MPTTVNIPDVGTVNFPDAMSEADIQTAIERDILPKKKSAVQPESTPQIRSTTLSAKEPLLEKIRRGLTPIIGPSKSEVMSDSIDGVYKPAASKTDREGLIPGLSHPFVSLPDVKPQDPKSVFDQTMAAVINKVKGMAETAESPFGLMTAGAGPAMAKTAAGLFGAHAVVTETPEFIDAVKNGDVPRAAAAATGAAAGVLMTTPLAKEGFEVAKSRIGGLDVAEAAKVAPATVTEVTRPETPADIQKPTETAPAPLTVEAANQQPKSAGDDGTQRRFDTIEDVLKFRQQRISEEVALYQQEIGLSKSEADKLQSLMAREADTKRFEASLSPDKKSALERFFEESPYNKIGGPFEFWEFDRRLNPEELAQESDKETLSSALVTAIQRGVTLKANNDRFISAIIAARRLQELGGTQIDLARYIDRFTTRESSSQPDKMEFFRSLSEKVGTFLRRQGIDFPEGQGIVKGVGNEATVPTLLEQATSVEQVTKPDPEIATKPASELLPEPSLDHGGVKPPPPDSPFTPDTPPDGNPWPIYAKRVASSLNAWWEKFWPRDLSVLKNTPDSPVISEHQRLIKSDLDYMEQFSDQPWWKAIRERPEEELIHLEDQVVKSYRQKIGEGEEPKAAYEAAVSGMPEDVQALLRHRDSRIPIETSAADELAVDKPSYTGDPYIARLTNEDGKDIVDLQPKIGNWGRQIRESIGSFDKSRSHPTMKEGIAKGTQYDPMTKAVWLRELVSSRLEATADMLRSLKGKVLFDTREEALAASPKKEVMLVRGFGGKDYYARSREEAVFLEQNLNLSKGGPWARIQQLANAYIRNPNLINPLPHTTKNMLFKYLLARVGNARFKADTTEFSRLTPTELKARFDEVMPMSESGERMPQLTAREVGSWAEKLSASGLKLNNPSTKFIFGMADPAMRFSLWKDYIRKGMSDQEAANHVWIDLIRYDANSGGINFWKSVPLNFFVPWRTGTYVTLAKQMAAHPVRSLLFIGAVEYLREMRYRKTGRWTHLPVDYIDAPLAEAISKHNASTTVAIAATTLVFGPGGGQAPSSIKDLMSALHNDPQNKNRLLNMFWGISQIYNIPQEFNAYRKDGKPEHLVNILTNAAISEHSALKYEPRRLMKWLPEWMPGLEKSALVKQAEQLRKKIEAKQEKSAATIEKRHGVSATFEHSQEEQQMQDLKRAAGQR